MKLGDIYKHKKSNDIIQIDSFAHPIVKKDTDKNFVIVFRNIVEDAFGIGSCPSFNGYGSQEEIEAEYELLVSQEELSNYSNWDEIFALIK